MRYLKVAAIGLVPLLLAAFWLRDSLVDERDAFEAFCNATRRAEPWPQVQERARRKGWSFVPQSPQGKQPEEHLAQVDVFGYRLGCAVVVKDGRVVETRYGELPAR